MIVGPGRVYGAKGTVSASAEDDKFVVRFEGNKGVTNFKLAHLAILCAPEIWIFLSLTCNREDEATRKSNLGGRITPWLFFRDFRQHAREHVAPPVGQQRLRAPHAAD